MWRSWLCIGSLTLAFLTNTRLHAQTLPSARPADELLDSGKRAYEQGRYGEALDAFEAAYRQSQDVLTLRRIGDAADKLGSHARAVEALSAYLQAVPDARDRAFIRSRIKANRALQDQAAAPKTRAPASAPPPRSAPAAATAQTATAVSRPSPAGPWWAWAAGGSAVVAGIVIAAVLVATTSSASTPEPIRGNVGPTVQTLGVR